MIADVLKDLHEKGGGEYFVRANEGTVEIIERGKNSTVWHFATDENILKVSESFDASKVVTRVKVIGKEKSEGHPAIEQTIDGKTDYGVRQVIYERPDKETLDEATKAARKILDEQGEPKRSVNIECVDLPTLRKGDKLRLQSATGKSFFFVKSIRHNAVNQTMSLELDVDKKSDKSLLGQVFDVAESNDSGSSEPL